MKMAMGFTRFLHEELLIRYFQQQKLNNYQLYLSPPRLCASAGEKYRYRDSRRGAEAQRMKMAMGFTQRALNLQIS